MAKTYVPGLKLACETLKRFIGRWKDKMQNRVSLILFAIAELLLDIVTIALSIMEFQENSDGQYDPTVPTNNTQYINQANAAIAKFNATMLGDS